MVSLPCIGVQIQNNENSTNSVQFGKKRCIRNAHGHTSPMIPNSVAEGHTSPMIPNSVAEGHTSPMIPNSVAEGHTSPMIPNSVAEGHTRSMLRKLKPSTGNGDEFVPRPAEGLRSSLQ